MDSQPPGAKPQSSTANVAVPQARNMARRYPKPPPFFRRFALLLLKPESWAAAAQYPFWVTFFPLLLALTIAAAAVGIGANVRFTSFMESFATSYDQKYPAMQVDGEGVLSMKSAATQPFDFNFNGAPFVVDTTGKTSFEAVKGDFATLLTDRKIYQRFLGNDLSPQSIADVVPYSYFVPGKGETNIIDGEHIRRWATEHRLGLGVGMGLAAFGLKFMVEALWIVATLFLIRPTIMVGAAIGEKKLILPKRAAYRIGAALLVPVVIFAGVMQAAGYTAGSVVGGENSVIFWFFACAGLGIWAGQIAKHLYAPKVSRPRAQ